MEDVLLFAERFGLPAVIVLWFMLRTEKVINRNTDAWIMVKEVITKCKGNKR